MSLSVKGTVHRSDTAEGIEIGSARPCRPAGIEVDVGSEIEGLALRNILLALKAVNILVSLPAAGQIGKSEQIGGIADIIYTALVEPSGICGLSRGVFHIRHITVKHFRNGYGNDCLRRFGISKRINGKRGLVVDPRLLILGIACGCRFEVACIDCGFFTLNQVYKIVFALTVVFMSQTVRGAVCTRSIRCITQHDAVGKAPCAVRYRIRIICLSSGTELRNI